MAEPRTREPHTVIPDAQGSASDRDDDALIARVCAARQAGDEDTQGVEELLRRAADRNRAALDLYRAKTRHLRGDLEFPRYP